MTDKCECPTFREEGGKYYWNGLGCRIHIVVTREEWSRLEGVGRGQFVRWCDENKDRLVREIGDLNGRMEADLARVTGERDAALKELVRLSGVNLSIAAAGNGDKAELERVTGELAEMKRERNEALLAYRTVGTGDVFRWCEANKDDVVKAIGDANGELEAENTRLLAKLEEAQNAANADLLFKHSPVLKEAQEKLAAAESEIDALKTCHTMLHAGGVKSFWDMKAKLAEAEARASAAEKRALMLNSALGRIIQIAEQKTLTTRNMREILIVAETYFVRNALGR